MSTPTQEMTRGVGRLAGLRSKYELQLQGLRGSDIAKAGGLAGAMIANNVIALISTVVFARELSDYGSLAALISYFLILGVAGQALQVATAREGVLGHLGVGPGLTVTLRDWARSLLIFTVVLTVISVLLRQPIANAVGVKHDPWAAAIGIPAGCLWLGLSIQRGALQGVGNYKAVGISLIGEQSARLLIGALLAIGLGVTGAYLGTPLSFVAMGLYCFVQLGRHARGHVQDPVTAIAEDESSRAAIAEDESHRVALAEDESSRAAIAEGESHRATISLWTHVKRAWAPIAGLIVIAVLQNIDIIAAKHRFNGVPNLASSYAATAVAAKVLIWVAIGAGFYLVPETSRRRAAGEDTRPVLMRALAIIVACAVPVLLIFAFAAEPLIRAAFGANRTEASGSLFILGLAFTVLAMTYLAIQYMLALKRTWFLVVLAMVAVAEPILLLQASHKPAGFAAVVLAIQAIGAILAFGMALRPDSAPPASVVSPEPA